MKKILLPFILIVPFVCVWADIDMQAHVASDEGQDAYTAYITKQTNYYQGNYAPQYLMAATGNELFGLLNKKMGETCKLTSSSYTYNTLREYYVDVDKDLNNSNNIIGFYDGRSMNGEWDSGKTWNREHTWPQSKGADKSDPMGHDMHSVRPASTSVNSSRGNDAYGEKAYDPDEVAINNKSYKKQNLGSYRGDAARVVLYDYVVYAQAGSYKNALYNSSCTLSKLKSSSGVFESLSTLLKWHMQDPPSLTEMVRNDGAQGYQGNRNPFIDFPELAIQMFKDDNSITVREVSYAETITISPHYNYTTPAGFICYVGTKGNHPDKDALSVKGATYTYDETLGRLTITNVTQNLTISVKKTGIEQSETQILSQPAVRKVFQNGKLFIIKDGCKYDIFGTRQ